MVTFWKPQDGKLTRPRLYSSESQPPPHSEANMSTTKPIPSPSIPIEQNPPIYNLPVELIQQISKHLEPASSASFCLSGRYICLAIGREVLSTYLLRSSSVKAVRRKNLEIVERAFPSHWYCAWCDQFHLHDKDGGPKAFEKEAKRDCAEFNSFLHAGKDYVVTFHHVRLAVNRALWGEEYGIKTEEFQYQRDDDTKVGKNLLATNLNIEAKIADGRLLLHSTFRITIPQPEVQKHSLTSKLLPAIPQIVSGHRNDSEGHTGFEYFLEQALHKNRSFGIQLCSTCATDYFITRHVQAENEQDIATAPVTLHIESWRDLGSGRSPFLAAWRAHGEIGNGVPGFGGDVVRLTGATAGQIRKAFGGDTDSFDSVEDRVSVDIQPRKRWHVRVIPNWTHEVGDAARTGSNQDHDRRVRQNNARLKAAGPTPGFTPPYGMSWDAFVDAGGMRGTDGIPLSDSERIQLTSGRGLFGG